MSNTQELLFLRADDETTHNSTSIIPLGILIELNSEAAKLKNSNFMSAVRANCQPLLLLPSY